MYTHKRTHQSPASTLGAVTHAHTQTYTPKSSLQAGSGHSHTHTHKHACQSPAHPGELGDNRTPTWCSLTNTYISAFMVYGSPSSPELATFVIRPSRDCKSLVYSIPSIRQSAGLPTRLPHHQESLHSATPPPLKLSQSLAAVTLSQPF